MTNNDDERMRKEDARAMRQNRDFRDLQDELAGRENGRLKRFLSDEEHSPRAAERKRAERMEAMTRLELLLATNQAYAQQYRQVMDQLMIAEAATARALAKAEAAQAQAEDDLQALRDRAARLDDGRLVFKDADGRVRDETGKILPDIDPDSVAWPMNAPTYEDWEKAQDHAQNAAETVDRVRDYQVDVLGRARDRLSDETNPPDENKLEEILGNIEEQMPPEVKAEARPEAPVRGPRDASIPLHADVPEL
ncbi:MAG: hypothetical protein AAGF48_13845 [Pseudomonadota bacterium]